MGARSHDGRSGFATRDFDDAIETAKRYVHETGWEATKEPLTESQFIVLSYLFRLGPHNVYSLHQAVRRERETGNPSARLALQTAYRSADWLKDHGLIQEVGEEFSSRNGIRMPVYDITDQGKAMLFQEIARLMLLSLSGLLHGENKDPGGA
jgi:DNA-binding PadR family transcriptional regulator